jgi:hypothetical protein
MKRTKDHPKGLKRPNSPSLPVQAYVPTATKRLDNNNIAAVLEAVTVLPGLRFANGDVKCPGWNDRIDRSVCITRSVRHQEKCAGATCPLNL